ncbi:unnamed protein product, partial [Brenthis ino]
MLKLTILLVLVSNSVSDPCNDEGSIDIIDGVHSNGEIVHDGLKYKRDEYFVDKNVTRDCLCEKKICINKCCPLGYAYYNKNCTKVQESFNPTIVDKYLNVQNINITDHFHFKPTKPVCIDEEVRIRALQVFNKLLIRTDGSLYIEVPNKIPPYLLRNPNKYCVDTFILEDGNGIKTSTFDALVCFTEDEDDAHYFLSSSCMLISCVFILATVTVYAWLPELRNLHGLVLMAYLASLFAAFINLGTLQILVSLNNIMLSACITMTFIIYFSLLSAFFWLNVMCFDIWWTFSGKRGMATEKKSIRAKFYAYCKYAFGVPTILTALLIGLEFSGLPRRPFLPAIRLEGCFLSGHTKLLYLYGPIVIITVVNLIFFTLTALKIAEIKKQTSVLKTGESATHDKQKSERQRLLLYVKLFAVMGVSWILEVISHIFPEANKIWCFTDAYNVLIGLLVFIIFVCKRKIFRLMKKRIKDGILRRNESRGSIMIPQKLYITRNLRDYQQRDSLDTIRTYCHDTDSNKDMNTTNL